jgi:molybdate transport system ATP-binding protein
MSALDTALRLKFQYYILKVHKQFNLTTILVSHDILEVITLSQRVYLMEQGQIVNQGPPAALLPVQAPLQMMDSLPDVDSSSVI